MRMERIGRKLHNYIRISKEKYLKDVLTAHAFIPRTQEVKAGEYLNSRPPCLCSKL